VAGSTPFSFEKMSSLLSFLGFNTNRFDFQILFDKNAIEENGEHIMTKREFSKCLQTDSLFPVTQQHMDLLFTACDLGKKGFVTKPEFLELETLLKQADAEYQILSRLITGQAKGTFSKKAMTDFFSKYSKGIDWNNDTIKSTFVGTESKSYLQFSQFIKLLRQERLHQFFRLNDPKNTGFIPASSVSGLLETWGGYKKESVILKNINSFGNMSFTEFHALFQILSRLDIIQQISHETFKSKQVITQAEFYQSSSTLLNYQTLTPLEIEMLFKVVGSHQQTATSMMPLFHPQYTEDASIQVGKLSAGMEMLKSVYNFTLGSIAGAIGAFAVYPIGIFL
jgi:solute carrier family 25 aspartate/glutamate transporter 12/13